MKQMDECLRRVFNGQPPLQSKKWKAFAQWHWDKQTQIISLYHYHHLVLVYDTVNHQYLYEWWEKPTDKRGLDAAKEYLEKRRNKYDSIGK
jgi:hypothetical protein